MSEVASIHISRRSSGSPSSQDSTAIEGTINGDHVDEQFEVFEKRIVTDSSAGDYVDISVEQNPLKQSYTESALEECTPNGMFNGLSHGSVEVNGRVSDFVPGDETSTVSAETLEEIPTTNGNHTDSLDDDSALESRAASDFQPFENIDAQVHNDETPVKTDTNTFVNTEEHIVTCDNGTDNSLNEVSASIEAVPVDSPNSTDDLDLSEAEQAEDVFVHVQTSNDAPTTLEVEPVHGLSSEAEESISSSTPVSNSSSPTPRSEPARTVQKLKDDEFVAAAGLCRTGYSGRKSSVEKLLEEQLNTGESVATSPTSGEDRVFARRTYSSRSSSTSTEDETKAEFKARKGSIYEQKQIDAPVVSTGSRINTRKQSLLLQYEKDMMGPQDTGKVDEQQVKGKVSKLKSSYGTNDEEKQKIQDMKDAKEKELEEVRKSFQQRTSESDDVEPSQPSKTEDSDVKARKSLGSLKEKYMAVAHGEKAKDTDESEGEEDNSEERVIGGKTVVKCTYKRDDIVRSGKSIGNIKSVFQNRNTFSSRPSNAVDEVDKSAINSARSMFKNIESKKEESQDRQRPTQRRVKDPKELMEMRKKKTYGDDESIQEGVVKKSVNVEEEMGSASAKESLAVYKQLEQTKEERLPVHRPTNRLLSDSDARETLHAKRGDDDDDEQSGTYDGGYGSNDVMTSPSSTGSDAFSNLSMHEDGFEHVQLVNGGVEVEAQGSEFV